MDKLEYHLLYVLSEPPVPVAQKRPHGWSPNDVLSCPQNPAFPSSDRFLVLDVNKQGRIMALQISEMSTETENTGENVEIGPKGLDLSEPGFGPASHFIRLDKIYFEPMITGKSHGPESVKVVGQFSESSMHTIILRLLAQESMFVKEAALKPRSSGLSDKWSINSSMIVNHSTASSSDNGTRNDPSFESFLARGYQLERFLDLAFMEFDEVDYDVIRNRLSLPKIRLTPSDDLNCDCDDHKRKSASIEDHRPRSFWRTWDKMVRCAGKLKLNRDPSEVLLQLSETSRVLGCQPGILFLHPFKPKPCYIKDLPAELLLNIIESFAQHYDKQSIHNFGLTCKLFHEIVNINLYRSIAISCDAEAWDKLVRVLPKYGHLTREIYLDAAVYDGLRDTILYENLRAIGDYCPYLERLDLSYPLRLDMTATEADLPPKFVLEDEAHNEEQEASQVDVPMAPESQGQPVVQADQDVEMQDEDQTGVQQADGLTVQQTEEQPNEQAVGELNLQMDNTTLDFFDSLDDENESDIETAGSEIDDPEIDGDNSDDEGEHEDNAGDNVTHNIPDPAEVAEAAARAAAMAAAEAARQARAAVQKRSCAELDHIIKNCPLLQNFSIQWTGAPALKRFYQKIPNLKGLRFWTSISDADLIATGKACQGLERFYIDGAELTGITLDGCTRFVKALHTKEDSKLKRVGLYSVMFGAYSPIHNGFDMEDDDDDDGMEIEDDDNGDGIEAPVFPIPVAPPPTHMDQHLPPLHKFIDVLSSKHPFLERLCLVQCRITDDLIPLLGTLTHLQGLDMSKPVGKGLSGVGINRIVTMFQGQSLSSLDLTRHIEITEDDMNTLTGIEGLKTLRYVRVRDCPKLKDKYIHDEYIHPDDFLMAQYGIWNNSLEIGDGWKEQWNE